MFSLIEEQLILSVEAADQNSSQPFIDPSTRTVAGSPRRTRTAWAFAKLRRLVGTSEWTEIQTDRHQHTHRRPPSGAQVRRSGVIGVGRELSSLNFSAWITFEQETT